MHYVKKWLANHRASYDNQSRKNRDTDIGDLRYGHMVSVFI